MKWGKGLAFAWAIAAVSAQLPAAPTGVGIRTDAASYYWVNGAVQVNWTAPAYAVASYNVQVAPLDYTHTFATANDTADFVMDVGSPMNSINVNNNALELHFSGKASSDRYSARGTAPLAYRRIPDSGVGGTTAVSFISVDVDCSQAPTTATEAACGIVIFNAATNLPLFTWSVVRSGG
jgi:hypothetical protein